MLRLVLVLCLLASPALAETYRGQVVGVYDGDTLTVLHDLKPEKIRLHGIDAPESKQPFGSKAKAFTSSQAFGKLVQIEAVDVDRYGRTIALVTLPDGRVLNHEILREGYGWWFRTYAPRDKTLENLETQARKSRLGLWVDKDPVPPWEWRKAKRP